MPINQEILRQEIENQVKNYSTFVNGEQSAIPSIETMRQAILQNENLMNLYNETDVDKLLSGYTHKVEQIAHNYTDPQHTDKRNILNVFEYMRFMSMFDNIKESSVFQYISRLSDSSISQAFLGKGVCSSQARLMRDILSSREINSRVLNVDFRDPKEPMLIVGAHDVTLVELEGDIKYLDPTWYKGTPESLVGSNGEANYGRHKFSSLEATQEEISESRKEVSQKLIRELGIDKVSKQIVTQGMDDIQKHCAIFTYIENRLNQNPLEVIAHSANMSGHNVEAGKLMELFFIENNIAYTLEPYGDKSQTVYKTQLNEEEVNLYPNIMFNSNSKKLTKGLHYTQSNDTIDYVHKRSPEILEKYKSAIKSGRDKAANLSLELGHEETDNAELATQLPLKAAASTNICVISQDAIPISKEFMSEIEAACQDKKPTNQNKANIINNRASVEMGR